MGRPWLSRAFGVAASTPPITSYTTTFPATENPISQGGIYLLGLTDGLDWHDIQTTGGTPGEAFAAQFDPGGENDPVCQLKTSFLACTPNQYSEGTVHINATESGDHEMSVFVNMTIAAHSITGYECYLSNGGAHSLVRWNGAALDFTPLASNNISSFTTPVEGDIIRITNVNGVLSCYQNGTLRTQFTDTTWTGGNPGFGNNPDSNGSVTLNGHDWKKWSCGNM